MNKMPILEATLPARDECLFPTQADARHHFARLHLFGKISCGIAYTDNNECQLVWLMQTRDGQHYPLQAFRSKVPYNGKIIRFRQENIGNYIGRKNHFYILCDDDFLGLTIREVAVYADQQDIHALYAMDNIAYEDISLVKVFSILPQRKFLFVSWLINRCDHTGEFRPAFIEDTIIHRGFDPTNITWETMTAGDTFMHFDEKFRVAYDRNTGWFFNKVFHNPYMRIVKSNI